MTDTPGFTSDARRGDILVVDDTPANLRLLTQILTERNYKVRPVPNGTLALAAARAALPDLILLDVNMPDMDGYTVCRELKADERTRDVPVMFISALDDVYDKVRAFSAGGVDYLTKPFQVEEVAARVATHLAVRHLQTALQAANADLQARNAELDSFARTVAHDLKNSLNTIMGHAELLDTDLSLIPLEEIRTSARAIARVSRKMNNIIEELMLLAGVRSQVVTPAPLDMAGIINEAWQRLDALRSERQPQLNMPEHWPTALGYGPWVEEVWVNYLGNAIKYGGTPPRVELGATPLANGQVEFWVRDNGRGLSPDEQTRLFAGFARLDHVRATGHGLGLSIVKQIVEKLGGQVGVSSSGVPGQGSTFRFTLPAA